MVAGWESAVLRAHLEEEIGAASDEIDHCRVKEHLAADCGVMNPFHEKGEQVAEEAIGSIPQFRRSDAEIVVRCERHQNKAPQADLEHDHRRKQRGLWHAHKGELPGDRLELGPV